jgi:ABC-2 type transport system ATP-binding protein
VRGLVKERGVGVLWATHLVDEVSSADRVVLLHKGRVRFAGLVPDLLDLAQAQSLRDAFMRVTADAPGEAAA